MTIKDVAREAGVSIATVSRVVNGKQVLPDSQLRVEQAIKKLGYVPNALASGLSGKKSKTIGVLITSLTNAYYSEITEVIEKRLRETQSMLFLGITDGRPEVEAGYLESLQSRQVEGVIMIDPTVENFENGVYRETAKRIPLVLIHSFREIVGLNSVYIDQEAGMTKVMEYLWDLGHRRIAFLRGNHGHSFDIKEDAWRAFYRERGSSAPKDFVISIAQGNTDSAIHMASRACAPLLALPEQLRPTAIFACNDLMALGALSAVQAAGLKVPQHVSVIGHDNTNLAKSSTPLMSTVDLKLPTLANEAADLLSSALEEYADAEHRSERSDDSRWVYIEPDLIIRKSSSAAKNVRREAG